MRRLVVPSALLACALAAGSAHALAPCFAVCHLAQGQPLFLADRGQVWARRCDTSVGTGTEACVVQRLDRSGKVLAEKPTPSEHDDGFTKAELDGHTVVQLNWQTAWTDQAKPYVVDRGARSLNVTMKIEKDTLVWSRAGGPAVRRPLGCAPTTVHVFAPMSGESGPTLAIAACATVGGEGEVLAVCD